MENQMELFLEKRVQNLVNETNLEYIKIQGLFGRYDIKIPFKQQVNIFIGENGLGKTTILNCIYYILQRKFSRLAEVHFSEISVKFRNDSKIYKITRADIIGYEKKGRRKIDYLLREEIISNPALYEAFYMNTEQMFSRESLDQIIENISIKYSVPRNYVRNEVMHYAFDVQGIEKGKKNNLRSLSNAIAKNVTHRIIYLPTYRRIENDFDAFKLRNEGNKDELLIRFGMSDVQLSIEKILNEIRDLAVKGFTEMTGVLLGQYADGVLDKNIIKKNRRRIDYDTVKIVLDRVGDEIEEGYKEKILYIVKNNEIEEDNYLHLFNLLNKLIDNYELQKTYDDRIKRFVETCNKYMNDKHFYYNQSTLKLNVILDDSLNSEMEMIPLTDLSSGEKQIVSLFSKLYLESSEKSIVIIDEPELSLSIQWQKMLLPDIMRSKNCDLLLTVTHSPFIFDNEFDFDAKEIRQFIRRTR